MSAKDVQAAEGALRRLIVLVKEGQLDAPSEVVHRLGAAADALAAAADAPRSA